MKKVHKKEIDIIQWVLDKLNERVNIEHDIELWNHCCLDNKECIEIIEE
jgi:hypothetical protein